MKIIKNKELIENLESKINVCKSLLTEEHDLYKVGKLQGMLDGFEYSLEKIKELPIYIPTIEKIAYSIMGVCFGIILGMYIMLN